MPEPRGTVSRLGHYVRGDCPRCGATDVLVYALEGSDELVCAHDYRKWAVEHPPEGVCDNCKAVGPVSRDPVTRKNVYLCLKCHDPERFFQNRWATAERASAPLGVHAKAVCDAAGYGTECKGEVKPRGGEWRGRVICNKHAGKTSAGPDWHHT